MSTSSDREVSTPPGKRVLLGLVLVLFLILAAGGAIGLGWRVLSTRPTLIEYIAMLVGILAILLAAIRYRLEWQPLWQRLKMDLRWQSGLAVLVVILWALLWWFPPDLTEIHEVRVCALGFDHSSDGSLKAFLADQARQQAADYFGVQQVRQISAAEFSPGKNLGEVCIQVTFDTGRAED